MDKETLLILDSNSLLNRAFYAIPLLSNREGVHTNAALGFTTMLFKMIKEFSPDYIVAAFDKKAPTFRKVKYDAYKAGRKKMPPELAEQFGLVKEILKCLSVNIYEIDGFEADDIIGTLSRYAESQGINVYIITGDRDALQLATDNIKVVLTKRGITETEIYDAKRMVTDFGVTPTQFIDVKALMGDKSDNIPGVPGVGEKTAFKLIGEYKTLEDVLSNAENLKGNKLRQNVMENMEQAVLSKKLATIITNVPIELNIDSIKSKDELDLKKLMDIFKDLEFNSLMNKIPDMYQTSKADNIVQEKIDVEYENIDSLKKLEECVKNFAEKIYIEFTYQDIEVFSKERIEKIYINCGGKNYVVDLLKILDEDRDSALKILKTLFEDESIKKTGYDFKPAYTCLKKLGIRVNGIDIDVKIAAYLINSNKGEYDIKKLLFEYLGVKSDLEGDKAKVFEVQNLEKLSETLMKYIDQYSMKELLFKLEEPLTKVLSVMESNGFKVDISILDELEKSFEEEIEKTRAVIYELAGEEFNISSPKQLGKILFEKLDLPTYKKTKTGYSTNAEVLEHLEDKHPIIAKIIYYRQLTKLYSTYVEGLKSVVDTDSKIHSNFNQTVTSTGRLSSTEPNLQNIPIKYEMGRQIRKVFVPENKDCVILSADYSQIELRVLSHIAGDENLIEAFKNHKDIHRKTASEVFKIPFDEVTSEMRSRAKAVNFGIVYGISDFSLAKDLKIPKAEAKSYIETYFERYPKVKQYLDDIIKKAKNDGYVETILNRRRLIPEINASNKIVRAFGERLAMNTPIQGSAADIIKLAMINVENKLSENNLKSSLILQVHDELILNVYKDELEKVKEIVKHEMEHVAKLNVPLEVDINIGDNWYLAK